MIKIYFYAGEYVRVPLSDLIPPPSDALFRPISEEHVQEIKVAILNNPDSNFTVMVANISDLTPEGVEVAKLQETGIRSYKYQINCL